MLTSTPRILALATLLTLTAGLAATALARDAGAAVSASVLAALLSLMVAGAVRRVPAR